LRRRLSQETIQVLIDAYKAGAISPQLAAQYGVSKTALLELLHAEGLAKRKRLTLEEIEEAHRLRSRGWTYVAIGQNFGMYGSTVWRTLKQN
jgi:hypothetical protein